MKKNTKIALIVISSVIVVAGVGTWLYLRNKNKKAQKDASNENDVPMTPPTSTPSTPSAPTTPSKPSTDFPLRMGSRNKKVQELQKLLICVGHLPKNDDDGIWGGRTESAMKKSPVQMNVIRNKSEYDIAIGRLYARLGGKNCD